MNLIKVLRRINTFVLVSGLFFLLQQYTLGFIPILRRIVLFNIVYLKDILFLGSSILLTMSTVHFEPGRRADRDH
ncbi:hypothetical protein GCM10028805_27280 [Spirosoma harenae]